MASLRRTVRQRVLVLIGRQNRHAGVEQPLHVIHVVLPDGFPQLGDAHGCSSSSCAKEPLRNNLYISFYFVTAPYAVSECLRSTYSLTTANDAYKVSARDRSNIGSAQHSLQRTKKTCGGR